MLKENKGSTLLELVIAITISILVLGTVAFFLCNSTGHYRRTREEINLQMEAQLILNQLENLILEAENVKFDSATDTLRIKQSDALYIITLNSVAHELMFEKVAVGGAETGNRQLFGRFVEELKVTDTGEEDSNDQIRISLSLRSNDSIYELPGNIIWLRNKIRRMDY